jgi:hypothetical protein
VIKESNIERHLHNKHDKDGKEVFKTHWSNVEELLDFAQRFNTTSADQDDGISQANSSQTGTQLANVSENNVTLTDLNARYGDNVPQNDPRHDFPVKTQDDSDSLVRFLDSTSLDLDSTNEEEEGDKKQVRMTGTNSVSAACNTLTVHILFS